LLSCSAWSFNRSSSFFLKCGSTYRDPFGDDDDGAKPLDSNSDGADLFNNCGTYKDDNISIDTVFLDSNSIVAADDDSGDITDDNAGGSNSRDWIDAVLSSRLLQPSLTDDAAAAAAADVDGNIDDGADVDADNDDIIFGGGGGNNTERGISIDTALLDNSSVETVRWSSSPNSR